MIDFVGEAGQNLTEKAVVIADCNCHERARLVEQELLKRYHLKESGVIDMKGISSLYASDGGVIIAFWICVRVCLDGFYMGK